MIGLGFLGFLCGGEKGLFFKELFLFLFCFLGFQTLHGGDEAFSMDFPLIF